MPLHPTNRRAVLTLALFALAAGCDGSGAAPVTPPPPQPAAIVLTPRSITIFVGADYQLLVTVMDASGLPLNGQPVSWSSINPPVVSVSETGVVHGLAVGTALVTAVSGPHLALDTVTVVAGPPAPARLPAMAIARAP